jgi:hypothetical protein
VVGLTLAVVGLAVIAWPKGWWRLAGRVYYTLATVEALGFIGLLVYWGLLGL